MTGDAVDSLLATTSVPDIEVTVVDNGSPMELGQELTARFVGEPRVRYRRLPINLNFAIACNIGFAESTGELVVFLNNDTRSDTDWLPGVLAHLDDPFVAGAQPVLLYPDQTIQTAGTVFPVRRRPGLPLPHRPSLPRRAPHRADDLPRRDRRRPGDARRRPGRARGLRPALRQRHGGRRPLPAGASSCAPAASGSSRARW